MDVPYSWLKTYIDFELEPEELAHTLTMLGLEVENIEFLGTGLKKIVTGLITEVSDHPEADNLKVCQVDLGDKTEQIVCGAPNVREGLRVPVAPAGSILPEGQEVQEVKLRGVTSRGMICSRDELGLQEERADGIMELGSGAEPGGSFIDYAGLNEYVFKIDITPNYARCLGLLGIARELQAVLEEGQVKYPEIELTAQERSSYDPLKVKIEDPELCPRYTARLLKNVEIGPSPDWMQKRLRSAGVRPINNIVDITNYVLLEYNQPLHAFDYDKISSGEIIVRRAEEREKLITLDDETRELTTDDLVIADPEGSIALAGVMGGADSEVTADTTNILLESAAFDQVSIRRTSRRLGLSSEAAYRFERGVDIEAVDEASRRASQLMQEYAGAEIHGELVDEYPLPYEQDGIDLDAGRVNQLLGLDLSESRISGILKKLDFEIEEVVSDVLKVKVPSYRNDVQQEADLVEEVARMYGYNNIPVTASPSRQQGKKTEAQKIREQVLDLMLGMGLDEIINISLMGKEIYDKLDIPADSEYRDWVQISNPLNESFSIMRTTLIPNMVQTLSDNTRHQQKELRFFERGRVFRDRGPEKRPREERRLCGGSMDYGRDLWGNDAADFYYLKGVLETLFSRLKLKTPEFKESSRPFLHPGRVADIYYKGTKIGFIGELKAELIDEFDLRERAAVFEISAEIFIEEVQPHSFEFDTLPKFPPVSRDLALVVPRELSASVILDDIDNIGGELLRQVNLFDVYTGEQIAREDKSLAFELLFQAEDRTLTDREVNEIFNKIVDYLKKEYDVEVRK